MSSNLCRVMESKEPVKMFVSPRNKKSVAKANQLQSVQRYGKQRIHKNILESKKQNKSVAMATFVAKYC